MKRNCIILVCITVILTLLSGCTISATGAASGGVLDTILTQLNMSSETTISANDAKAETISEMSDNRESAVSETQSEDAQQEAVSSTSENIEASISDIEITGEDSSETIQEENTDNGFKRGGITWLSPSEEALTERENLQKQPRNFVWKSVFFKITMWTLRDNYKQDFPDQWTACTKGHLTYGNNDVYTLTPVMDDTECIILYIHGGGYVYSINADEAMDDQLTVCDKLAINLHAKVYIPLYTLSPRGTWKDCYQLLDQVYKDLEATGKPIYIFGDSAGGGTALAYTMFRRDRGDTLPDKLLLSSPWLDMTLSNTEISTYERTDNILSPYALKQFGKFWSKGLDATDPLVSPIYGDLSNLPPTLVFAGTEEIMYPDIAKLYENMKNENGDISLVCGQQLWHNFIGSDIPESDECIDMMIQFCKSK